MLKSLKVFRKLCSAILQYFLNFFKNFHYHQQQFGVFIFCDVGAKSKKTKKKKKKIDKNKYPKISQVSLVSNFLVSVLKTTQSIILWKHQWLMTCFFVFSELSKTFFLVHKLKTNRFWFMDQKPYYSIWASLNSLMSTHPALYKL